MKEACSIESRISEQLDKSPFYFRPLCLWVSVFLMTLAAFLLWKWVGFFLLLPWAAYSAFCFVKARSAAAVLPWLLLSALLAAFAVYGVYFGLRSDTRALLAETERLREEYEAEKDESDTPFTGDVIELRAVVVNEYYCETYGSAYEVKLIEGNGKRIFGRATLEADEPLELLPYETVECDARISAPDKAVTLSDRMYAVSSDVMFKAEVLDSYTSSRESCKGFFYLAYSIRERLIDRMEKKLAPGASVFAAAVLFGDTDGLSDRLNRDVAALGISHLLAVSGSHLAVISAVLSFLLTKLKTGKRWKTVTVVLLVLFYSALCGFSPSVARSAVMLAFSAAVSLCGYRSDGLTALFFSVGAICMLDPLMILDAGLLLSYFATLGLLLVSETALYQRLAKPDSPSAVVRFLFRTLAGVLITVAAILMTLPVSALFFEEMSVAAVAVNIIAMPCINLALIVAAVLCAVSGIPFIGTAAAWCFTLLYRIVTDGAAFLAEKLPTTASLAYPFVPYLFILCAGIYLFFRLNGERRRLMAFVPLVTFVVAFAIVGTACEVVGKNKTELVFAAEGRNEAFVIVSGGRALICDASDGSKSVSMHCADIAESDYYRTRIGGYMITHYHARHLNTALKLMTRHFLDALYLPEPQSEQDAEIAFSAERLAEKYKCEIIYYRRGEAFDFEDVTLTADTSGVHYSTHPAIYISIDAKEKGRVTYWSEGVTDSELIYHATEAATESGALILGAHGPGAKEATVIYSALENTDGYLAPLRKYTPLGEVGKKFIRLPSDADKEVSDYVFKLQRKKK